MLLTVGAGGVIVDDGRAHDNGRETHRNMRSRWGRRISATTIDHDRELHVETMVDVRKKRVIWWLWWSRELTPSLPPETCGQKITCRRKCVIGEQSNIVILKLIVSNI